MARKKTFEEDAAKRDLSLLTTPIAPEDKSVDGHLTEKQVMFVHHYVHDRMNQTASARLAGYSSPGVDANVLLKQPKIQKAIAEQREEYARASQMTKQRVIEGFTEAIDMARVGADPIAMISGWREIGKMCGLYEATKTQIEVSVSGKVLLTRMQGMSDEELLQLANQNPSILEGDFSVVESESPAPSTSGQADAGPPPAPTLHAGDAP